MTDPLTQWLDEMEAKCRAATPGPYTTDYDRDRCLIDVKGHVIALTYDRDFFSADTDLKQSRANAAYLAALPPETVSALLECVRAAALASDEIQSQRTAWPGEVDDLADALARLRRMALGDA